MQGRIGIGVGFMEIQKILFPQIGRCTEKELYFRLDRTEQGIIEEVKTQYSYENQLIQFDRFGKVWFDTYFNGLSIEKWNKYTTVKNISLRLRISGKFKVILHILHSVNGAFLSGFFNRAFTSSTV